jgi:hypothetical protein
MSTVSVPLKPGDLLAEVLHCCDVLQSKTFADATGNFHRIHWDEEYARSEQLPCAIVNSGILMAWVEMDLQNTYGNNVVWREMDFKFQKAVPLGTTVAFGGVIESVSAAHEARVALEIKVWLHGLSGTGHLTGNVIVEAVP